LERFEQFLGERFSIVGQVTSHGLALEVLPEAFDRIEVGAVRCEIDGLDVMPV
jgi:hypothetical protein